MDGKAKSPSSIVWRCGKCRDAERAVQVAGDRYPNLKALTFHGESVQ